MRKTSPGASSLRPALAGRQRDVDGRVARIERALHHARRSSRRPPISSDVGLGVARSRARSRGATAGSDRRRAARRPSLDRAARPAAARSVGAGSSGCGVFDSTTSVSISKRSSTAAPGAAVARRPRPARPSSSTPTSHEEVHVGDDVALAEAVLAELDQQVVARVAVKVVAQLLVATRRRSWRRAAAASPQPRDGVVPAAVVGDDRARARGPCPSRARAPWSGTR